MEPESETPNWGMIKIWINFDQFEISKLFKIIQNVLFMFD